MKIVTTEDKPIKLWLNDIEGGALDQCINMANLPFTFKHVAIMPDAHQGYGMPIGGVLATKGVVIPNAVGVDIGCGMCAIKTNLHKIPKHKLSIIKENIEKIIPVGFSHQQKPQDKSLMPDVSNLITESNIVLKEYNKALHQLGTLGGGNHFIEIQEGTDTYIWIMIHSGSRNIGLKVASYHNKIAVELNEKYHSSVDRKIDLAFLPIGTYQYQDYLKEMQFCVDFAFANRKLMMERVKEVFIDYDYKTEFSDFINITHNYARMESHFNTNVMVHRKGATSAKKGELGIIPGSQGTKSYIVRGLGNPMSFMSCSHGAGRMMGRKQAIRELVLEDELSKMGDVLHNIKNADDLDEACGAYKDIDIVMENQKDLVDKRVELKPLAVIKG